MRAAGDDRRALRRWPAVCEEPCAMPLDKTTNADDGEAQDQDPTQLIESYLARVATETEPPVRAQLLRQLSWLFENQVRDPTRALTARLAAYREQPQRSAWSSLERLAAVVDGWAELIGELSESVSELPLDDRADAWVYIGGLYEKRLGHPDQALACYRYAVDSDGDCAEARQRLEALLRARGEHAELVRMLEERLLRAPALEQRAVALELAALHAQLGDRQEAIHRYEELRAQLPGDLALLRALAPLYEAEGRVRELVAVLDAQAGLVEGARDRAALYRRMAVEWEQQLGDTAKAEECLEWVLTFDPQCEDAYRALERLYCADGRWRAAVDVYARHATIATPARRVELNAEAARICERQLEDAAGALDCIRKIEIDRPAAIDAMSAPIRLYERTEDFDHLVDLLERRAARADGNERAELFHRVGELMLRQLDDADGAALRFARALEANPAHVPSLLALAEIHRQRGELGNAAKLLREATGATPQREERARLVVLEAELLRTLGDVDGAATLYAGVLEIDPDHLAAARCLVELLAGAGRLAQLRAPLELLATKEVDTGRRLARLVELAGVEERLGAPDRALLALDRALALDATHAPAQRARAALLLAQARFADAQAALTAWSQAAPQLSPAEQVELRWQLGLAALGLDQAAEAQKQLAAALALDPTHRPSLRAQIELDRDRPEALLGHYQALLAVAPVDEQPALWSGLGDVHTGRGELVRALEAYRQALALSPEDPRLLHKCLDSCVAQKAWTDTLPLLERLITVERMTTVRGRYAQAIGLILYHELGRVDEAVARLTAAIDDDPTLERAAAALEEIFTARRDWTALANLYCLRLQRLGPASSDGEQSARARLWSKLGELCLTHLSDRDSALAAFEVAARFDPKDVEAHRQLAALYLQAEDRLDSAITQHQLIVAAEPSALDSYNALAELHRRAGAAARAAACAQAAAFLERRRDGTRVPDLTELAVVDADDGDGGDEQLLARASATLTPELWARLHADEDRHLSALFALLLPYVVAAQAQPHRQHGLDRRDLVGEGDQRAFARALRYVARVLGVPAPDAFVRYEQRSSAEWVSCVWDKRTVATLVVGKPLLGTRRSERELVFQLATTLSYLRPGRLLARLAQPAQLAQLIDAAMALGSDGEPAAAVAAVLQPLKASLPPLVLDQMAIIGRSLVERNLRSDEAVLAWLRATELTAGRVGLLLVGDLTLCARLLEAEACASTAPGERVLDLVAASVGEAMFAAREQLRLGPPPSSPPRPRPVTSAST
jgi:tetratricopeptide (TPR) repeat protein